MVLASHGIRFIPHFAFLVHFSIFFSFGLDSYVIFSPEMGLPIAQGDDGSIYIGTKFTDI